MTFAEKLEHDLKPMLARARKSNVRPDTLVQYATKDNRALGAMRRKAASLDAQMKRITAFLDQKPDP
jgi:hypothetical protein